MPAAHPGDEADDRVAIQNALDSQGCAYLPAGVYDIDTIQAKPPARRQHEMLDASGAQIYGDGPGTVLVFRGSTGGEDWEGVSMTGAGSALHDLSLDTKGISDTEEQTHAVKIMGPASDAEIARVSFNHPIREGKSGDCVQLVGFDDGREIKGVRISENDFAHCDRSGVGVHSGTTGLDIVDNSFEAVGNTDLDFEGSGDTNDVLIQHNTFTMSPGPHGVASIQLQLVDDVRIADNVLDGRGIDDYQSDDVEIDHNQITLKQATGEPVIFVHKDSSRTQILDNSITRDASAGDGPVISAAPHGSGTPDHLTIEGNALVQQTNFHVVSTSGLVGLYIRHNTLTYSGALANVMSGVLALGSADTFGIRTTDVHVDANTFAGPLRSAVSTSGSYFGAGTVDTSDNVATGATYGIYCENYASQGGITGPITSTGDSWPAPECGPKGYVRVSAGSGTGDGTGTPSPGPAAPPGTGTAPNTRLRKRPRSKSANRLARFAFAADQSGSTFKCKLDGRAFEPCRSSLRMKVARGRHVIRVQAVGPTGTPDPSPAVFRWTVL